MESNKSTYKLDQGGQEYMFSTSIVGDLLRLSCKNTSSTKTKKYYRDFSIEQLQKIDKLFNVLKTPLQATEYIDQALRQQKVGVSEESNSIKITFYITTKGITNTIDIPLWNTKGSKINGNSESKTEKIENYEFNTANNNINTHLETNNYEQYIFDANNNLITNENTNYNQYDNNNNEINAELNNLYTNTNVQDIQNVQTEGDIDLNKYFTNIGTTSTNDGSKPYITAADDITNETNNNQYYQNYEELLNTNTSDINQYTNELEGIQLNNNHDKYEQYNFAQVETRVVPPSATPMVGGHAQTSYPVGSPIIESPRPKIQKIEENNINLQTPALNFDEQIKHILQQDNNTNIITTQGEEKDINRESKPLTTTKVLPVKTTTRVLPPIGPFTSLEGLDLHKLGMMNSEHQKMPPYEQLIENNNNNTGINNINIPMTQAETKIIETRPKFITTEGQTKTKTTITTINSNKTTDNVNAIKQITASGLKKTTSKIDSQTEIMINNIKNENLSLKKQLLELRNSQVNDEKIIITKNQLNELENLRKKVSEIEILRGQLTELNSLRAQVAEYNAIKGQLKELNFLKEKIKQQNIEILELKNKLKDYEAMQLKVSDLENIKSKYEEDIKGLKESMKLYSLKTSNLEENKDDKENNDEDTPEEITVKGDIIHDTNELELITKKINKHNQKLTLNLLYKATADSDKAAAFHAKCDEAKSSIVLVETDKGKRFGGFTTCSWSGDCEEKKDEDAFVFSLDKMKTYDNIPGEDAIGCYPKFGPIFLGCQIRIYDNAFTKGGTTFERGLNFDTEENFQLSGGDRQYKVKEIEVYEVVIE